MSQASLEVASSSSVTGVRARRSVHGPGLEVELLPHSVGQILDGHI